MFTKWNEKTKEERTIATIGFIYKAGGMIIEHLPSICIGGAIAYAAYKHGETDGMDKACSIIKKLARDEGKVLTVQNSDNCFYVMSKDAVENWYRSK